MNTIKSALSQDTIVEIKGLVKGYGEEERILNGFSLDINKGEVMCLLGANGSGKTTLVNILSGLTESDAGDVVLHLEDNTKVSLRDQEKAFRSYIRLCQ